jgi:hypothetical protein
MVEQLDVISLHQRRTNLRNGKQMIEEIKCIHQEVTAAIFTYKAVTEDQIQVISRKSLQNNFRRREREKLRKVTVYLQSKAVNRL